MKEKNLAKRERFNNESKKICKEKKISSWKKKVLPIDKGLGSKHDQDIKKDHLAKICTKPLHLAMSLKFNGSLILKKKIVLKI
jgi:hypothetical protein